MRNVLRNLVSQWQPMNLERLEERRFLSVTPSVANIREATGARAGIVGHEHFGVLSLDGVERQRLREGSGA